MRLPTLLALRRQVRAPFRLHPLGFIACTLISEGPKKVRLHYWPVTGGAQQSPHCQIHDHLFEFKSWVFTGAVQNIEYSVSDSGIELAEYRAEYVADLSVLSKTGNTLRLVETRRTIYRAGSRYQLPAGVLHETIRVGMEPAFTVLIANDVSTKLPLVLGPLGGQDRYLYRRQLLSESDAGRLITGV
jgi:hypothetical protein